MEGTEVSLSGLWVIGGILVFLYFFVGIRIVRPTNRGLVERLGKYHHFAQPGFHWIIPAIDKMYRIILPSRWWTQSRRKLLPTTISMLSSMHRYILRSNPMKRALKNSVYNVNNVNFQIVNLAARPSVTSSAR